MHCRVCTSHVQFVSIINAVICQYRWNCTAPDQNGQRYIPNETDRGAETAPSAGDSLYIFRVPILDVSCYGPVTAIEYCYEYSTNAGSGQPTFNWTVLILEDTGNNFVINSIYFILSHLPLDSANCTNDDEVHTCCDRTNIEGFDLPTLNFAFGVIESAQGSTHEAALLGFSDALPQYRVDVVPLNRAEVTLSIGSTIRNRSPVQRGIRMLWFVIGKHQYSSSHDIVYPTLVIPLLRETKGPGSYQGFFYRRSRT